MKPLSKINFESQGERCCGVIFRNTDNPNGFWIIMGHGLACIKEMQLASYAERFVEKGFNVLTFDYRHFGESDGQPRQIIDTRKQHQDWLAAIDYISQTFQVAHNQICIWGSSLGGGHVLEIAYKLPNLAGVISQVPHTSALAAILSAGPFKGTLLTCVGVYDRLRGIAGLSPFYINASGVPGELAFMTGPGEHEGYMALVPDGMTFDPRVAARFALDIIRYSPVKRIKHLALPVLIQVGLQDITTPAKPVIKACRLNDKVQLKIYDVNHFEPYRGDSLQAFLNDQVTFLKQITTS
jgi:pimeloyl-ACP methyl ester carboxylesterase